MNDDEELAPPPLLSENPQIGKDRSSAGRGPDEGSDSTSESQTLENPERLRELQESWTSPEIVDSRRLSCRDAL